MLSVIQPRRLTLCGQKKNGTLVNSIRLKVSFAAQADIYFFNIFWILWYSVNISNGTKQDYFADQIFSNKPTESSINPDRKEVTSTIV